MLVTRVRVLHRVYKVIVGGHLFKVFILVNSMYIHILILCRYLQIYLHKGLQGGMGHEVHEMEKEGEEEVWRDGQMSPENIGMMVKVLGDKELVKGDMDEEKDDSGLENGDREPEKDDKVLENEV